MTVDMSAVHDRTPLDALGWRLGSRASKAILNRQNGLQEGSRPSRRGVDRNPVMISRSNPITSRPSRRGVDRNQIKSDSVEPIVASPLAQGRGSKRHMCQSCHDDVLSPLAQGRGSKRLRERG